MILSITAGNNYENIFDLIAVTGVIGNLVSE